MKAWKIFWGMAFVLLAVLLILDAIGILTPYISVFGEITFWQIFGGFALLCGVVTLIGAGQFWQIFVPLGFIFMIFERNIAYACGLDNEDIINNWLVFGCSLLLSAGFMFLIPKRKKKKKSHFKAMVNGKEYSGSSQVYIDCSTFEEEYIKNHLGALEIRFTNKDQYSGGGVLQIENHLGATEIYVPSEWKLDLDQKENSLGAIDWENIEAPDGAPTLKVIVSNSLGAIDIERD